MEGVGTGAITRALGAGFGFLLDLFRSQLEAYVDLKLFAAHPYEVVLLNRSRHKVRIDRLLVIPDGFPSEGSGWQISDKPFFSGRELVQGQSVRILLRSQDLGEKTLRVFLVDYTTHFFGLKIARKRRRVEHDFDITGMTISVSSSLSTSYAVGDRINAEC